MLMRRLILALMLLLPAAAVGAALPAEAQVKPLKEILQGLPREYSGRILDTRLQRGEYRIRILKQSGEVVELTIDAKTGKIVDEQQPGGG